MPTTTPDFVEGLIDDLVAEGVPIADPAGLKATLASSFTEWLGGDDAIPADTARKLATAIGNINLDAMQRLDWWTGSATGGWDVTGTVPGGGHYPMTNAAGTTTFFPSLAKIFATLGTVGDPADAIAAVEAAVAVYLTEAQGYADDAAAERIAAAAIKTEAEVLLGQAEAAVALPMASINTARSRLKTLRRYRGDAAVLPLEAGKADSSGNRPVLRGYRKADGAEMHYAPNVFGSDVEFGAGIGGDGFESAIGTGVDDRLRPVLGSTYIASVVPDFLPMAPAVRVATGYAFPFYFDKVLGRAVMNGALITGDHGLAVPGTPAFDDAVNEIVGDNVGAALSVSPYMGPIATGCYHPGTQNTAGAYDNVQGRTPHYVYQTIRAGTPIRIRFANNFGTEETPTGASLTVRAALELPDNTFVAFTWSGVRDCVIASGDDGAWSDPLTFPADLPPGLYFTRSLGVCPAGVALKDIPGAHTNGGGMEASASALTDKTLGGTIPVSGLQFGPVQFEGITSLISIGEFGDSMAALTLDNIDDPTGFFGLMDRSIGPHFPFVNNASPGQQLINFVANHGKRIARAANCSVILGQVARNDFNAGRTAAQMIALVEGFAAQFPDKPVLYTTTTPDTLGAWSLPDGSDQTVTSWETHRIAFNRALRSFAVAGIADYIDVAKVMETSFEGGKWYAGDTPDGIHPSVQGFHRIRDSGVFNPLRIARARRL